MYIIFTNYNFQLVTSCINWIKHCCETKFNPLGEVTQVVNGYGL